MASPLANVCLIDLGRRIQDCMRVSAKDDIDALYLFGQGQIALEPNMSQGDQEITS